MDASTAQEMSPFIGRLAMLVTGELTISVQILDVRHVWQRTDFKVTPKGTTMSDIAERVVAGAAWLDEQRPGWANEIGVARSMATGTLAEP
jgi:hypothetical protein